MLFHTDSHVLYAPIHRWVRVHYNCGLVQTLKAAHKMLSLCMIARPVFQKQGKEMQKQTKANAGGWKAGEKLGKVRKRYC